MDTGRLVVDAPPDPPTPAQVNPLARLMPVAMLAAMAGMTAMYLTSTDSPRNPMFLFFPAMMLVSSIGTLAYGAGGPGRTAELNDQRAAYLRYLDTLDGALAAAAEEQIRVLHHDHPEPAALWTLAGGERMWERADDHPDFCVVRIGVGEQPAATTVVAPELGADDEADPVTAGALRRLVRHRSVVAGVPVVVPLRSTAVITVSGDPEAVRTAVRALVCQLAVLHDPRQVTVGVASPAPHWDWLKWLPHHCDTPSARHHVVVVDGARPPEPAEDVTCIVLQPDDRTEVTVHLDGQVKAVSCDQLSPADAVACARRLARYRPGAGARRPGGPDWLSLMGIDDPEQIDVGRRWLRRSAPDLLRVPIGVAPDGAVVELDIKESAAAGLGPHGLCVGATGSGKSEFLRTLVLGMITAHPPELLNLVLVDFKGGATFLGKKSQYQRLYFFCARRHLHPYLRRPGREGPGRRPTT